MEIFNYGHWVCRFFSKCHFMGAQNVILRDQKSRNVSSLFWRTFIFSADGRWALGTAGVGWREKKVPSPGSVLTPDVVSFAGHFSEGGRKIFRLSSGLRTGFSHSYFAPAHEKRPAEDSVSGLLCPAGRSQLLLGSQLRKSIHFPYICSM